jgi:hypothetical protein
VCYVLCVCTCVHMFVNMCMCVCAEGSFGRRGFGLKKKDVLRPVGQLLLHPLQMQMPTGCPRQLGTAVSVSAVSHSPSCKHLTCTT